MFEQSLSLKIYLFKTDNLFLSFSLVDIEPFKKTKCIATFMLLLVLSHNFLEYSNHRTFHLTESLSLGFYAKLAMWSDKLLSVLLSISLLYKPKVHSENKNTFKHIRSQ